MREAPMKRKKREEGEREKEEGKKRKRQGLLPPLTARHMEEGKSDGRIGRRRRRRRRLCDRGITRDAREQGDEEAKGS